MKAGATNLRTVLSSGEILDVLKAYMKGIRDAFLVAIVASTLAAVVSMGSRWKSASAVACLNTKANVWLNGQAGDARST